MRPSIVSGIVIGDASSSHWPIFFFLPLVNVPEVFANVSSAQFPSGVKSGELTLTTDLSI